MEADKYHNYIRELSLLPDKINEILQKEEEIKKLAAELKDCPNAIYLGRGCQYPVALEGALKLKEISYIHAEGYPAAEMKHGPIALIDEKCRYSSLQPGMRIMKNHLQYQRSGIPERQRNSPCQSRR